MIYFDARRWIHRPYTSSSAADRRSIEDATVRDGKDLETPIAIGRSRTPARTQWPPGSRPPRNSLLLAGSSSARISEHETNSDPFRRCVLSPGRCLSLTQAQIDFKMANDRDNSTPRTRCRRDLARFRAGSYRALQRQATRCLYRPTRRFQRRLQTGSKTTEGSRVISIPRSGGSPVMSRPVKTLAQKSPGSDIRM